MILYSLSILVVAVTLFFGLRRFRFATRLVIALLFFIVGVGGMIAWILMVGDEPLPGARTIDLEELRQQQEQKSQRAQEELETALEEVEGLPEE